MKSISMRLKAFYFFVFILAIGLSESRGQDLGRKYQVSYLGNNIWNEGLQFDLIQTRSVDSLANGKLRKKGRMIDLGLYRDNDTHTALFISAGWHREKIRKNRFYTFTNLKPIGIYRSFLPKTFEILDDGSLHRVTLPGRFYFAPGLDLGFGRYLKKRNHLSWFTNFQFTTLLPYNHYVLPLLHIEFGFSWNLKNEGK